MNPTCNANDIIQEIDAGRLHPLGNAVARELLRRINFQHEIIDRYDRGEDTGPLGGAHPIFKEIFALPLAQQGALRLVTNLAHEEDELDWYSAEFFIAWARQEGVSEPDICAAFGFTGNGG
jgi:hypothetical protein